MRLTFVLLAALLIVLLLTESDGNHAGETLPYSEALLVFRSIAEPYEEIKTERNEKMDKQVDGLISRIMSILPELSTLHNCIQNLSAGVPVFASRIGHPLDELKQSLKRTVQDLSMCQPRGVLINDTPQSESDEEVTEDTVEPKYKHESRKRSVANLQEITGLFAPLGNELSADLNKTLNAYKEYSVISLRDAAQAFKAIANLIASEHASRFTNLVPKIFAVNNAIKTITEHVTTTKNRAADLHGQAMNFLRSSAICVQELTNLTQVAQSLAGSIC
jgi:hypothetical protein